MLSVRGRFFWLYAVTDMPRNRDLLHFGAKKTNRFEQPCPWIGTTFAVRRVADTARVQLV